MLHAQLRERVDDCVDHGAEGRCRAALAPAAEPERIRRRRDLADLRRERRQHVGARDRVLHEGRGERLAGLRVVVAALPQRLAHTLGDAAVRLAMHDHGIDGPSDVVHRRVANDLHHTGLCVDLDLAHGRSIGKGRRAVRLVALRLKRATQLGGRGG